MIQAANLLDIEILDHIIIGEGKYESIDRRLLHRIQCLYCC